MKRSLRLLFFFGLFCFVGNVNAYSVFESVVDWNTDSGIKGRTAMQISDSTFPSGFEFSHIVSFNPPAFSINSATLSLSHYGNSANSGELWALSASGNIFIANLVESKVWVDQIFALPAEIYSLISGNTWSIAIKLSDNTLGEDKLWIDKSALTGEYTPVPIPSAAWLLAPSLLGLVALRRKFQH
jgi:hypothetical protein